MRKHDAIDLLKLYSAFSSREWNAVLTNCHKNHDITKLAQLRYSLQAGMDNLAKKKLNSQKLILWFIRLQTSIENTMKQIIKEKHPNPCDDPKKAADHAELKERKKDRDHELELFFKKSGY